MARKTRPVFRERALQHYQQGRNQEVLPRLVTPPVFVGLWLVVSLCLVAGWLAWNIRVPVSIAGRGVVVAKGTQAVLFVSADQQRSLHPGESVQLRLGSTGPLLHRAVTTVAPTLVSPEEARQDYHLDGSLALLVTAPSVVLLVTLDPNHPLSAYAGSIVSAQVQVGEVSILSFLPLVGQWIGA